MKLKFINTESGEEMVGDYFVQDGDVWQFEFGSCDKVPNPTHMWAGEAWKVTHPVKVILED